MIQSPRTFSGRGGRVYSKKESTVGKYFGTDGIRGKYGDNLDAALSYKAGRALAEFFDKGECFVGRDTRVSGPEIEEALVKGITDGGGNITLLGILPTPAVAQLAIRHGAACGIMISASHNPPEYNGIKIFDSKGIKLTEEQEGSVEYYIDNQPAKATVKGRVRTLGSAAEEYVDAVVAAAGIDFGGLKVRMDCGYGAVGTVAKEAWTRLGADIEVENCSMRGEKINGYCGALYPEYVRNSMKATDTRLGFACDGDADRLSVVMDGEIVDGDSVLYNISRGITLNGNVVVGTVLSNLALEKKLESEGKKLLRTPVGDKFICDIMFRKGYNLGGEQSGHFIVYPAATTGDGLLSSIFFTRALLADGKLTKPVRLNLCPQKAIAEYASPSILYDEGLLAMIDSRSERLAGIGRLIVRMSGTEPKVRVMVECERAELVDEILEEFRQYIRSVKA